MKGQSAVSCRCRRRYRVINLLLVAVIRGTDSEPVKERKMNTFIDFDIGIPP